MHEATAGSQDQARGLEAADPLLLARAERILSAQPRPFLKWAGSKRHLLTQIVPFLPSKGFGTYYEPFVGSGALYFLLRPTQAVLADTCRDLIQTYAAVADKPRVVMRYVNSFGIDRETYYRVRSRRSSGPYKRAAEFIYLNKTCWNGLYRVNSKGVFNVPYGAPSPNAAIVDRDNLIRCGELLASAHLAEADFEETIAQAGRGDLVFIDPPYVTSHNNNGFIDYNEKLFSWGDQVRLADCARSAVDRGAHVIATNAAHSDVLALYTDRGFHVHLTERHSGIASLAKHRKRVTEAILLGCLP